MRAKCTGLRHLSGAFRGVGLQASAHQFEHGIEVLDQILSVRAESFESDAECSDGRDGKGGGVGLIRRVCLVRAGDRLDDCLLPGICDFQVAGS
jgi:hypothetical protein